MDNIKTGNLIKYLRKEKGMTQKDLADRLHITDRAVSKWERGICAPDIALFEPLSEILGVSITELISGEQLPEGVDPKTEETVTEVVTVSSVELNHKTRSFRKTVWLLIATLLIVIMLWVFNLYSPVIFQRGNPIPYISAALQIDAENHYVKVGVSGTCDVYITMRGDYGALFYDMAYNRGFELLEQAGSGYIFSDGTNRFTISSEVYLRYFTVWTVPTYTFEEVS